MKVEYINPFINATRKVLNLMAFVESTPSSPYVKNHNEGPSGDISALIKLSGEIEGSIGISFTAPCAIGVAEHMFGEKYQEVNEEIADMVGELVNMVSGEARKELANLGLHFSAGIPTIEKGEGHKLKHPIRGPVIIIPFQTQGGEFFIEACFESEAYLSESLASQRSVNVQRTNNCVELKKVSSYFSEELFSFFSLKKGSMETKSNMFLFKEYTSPKIGFDNCNFLLLEVGVCPETKFASNQIEFFKSNDSTQKSPSQFYNIKEELKTKLSKLSLLGQFNDNFYTPNRTVEQGITAFELAIFTSNSLFQINRKVFGRELFKIMEYSLKASLLCKYQLDSNREIKYINTAQKVAEKVYPFQPLPAKFRMLYLLTIISLYKGDVDEAKAYFDEFFDLHKKGFESLVDQKIMVKVNGYKELMRKAWSSQESIYYKKNRKIKNYLYIDTSWL